MKQIGPQPGYQQMAMESSADVLIGGGAAGVGKTFTLLLEPLRNIKQDGFGTVIFRRTSPMIRAEGGLWDASEKLYRLITGANGKRSALEWKFPNGNKIKFSHLEYEKNIFDWQGSEIPLIGFDELTHFSRKMFFYLLSRNRSTCGVDPYLRATCNPDPDSWVADFIDWWIDDDGWPIEERFGKLRYFMLDNNNYIWGQTKKEVIEKGWHVLAPLVEESNVPAESFVKSLTFIGGNIYQNRELLTTNPAYLGNLSAQDEETKKRLLLGNWKHSEKASDLLKWKAFLATFSNDFVRKDTEYHQRYITADIALKGSDKFVIFCWRGKMLIDFHIEDKSTGPSIINAIRKMANRHRVPAYNICFDNDGVGAFVGGFIEGSVEFNNGSKALNDENYANLKTQCFYKLGDSITRGDYFIPAELAERPYSEKMNLRDRLLFERQAIKRDKMDMDGKLRIIPKQQMKNYIQNQSPDLMDAMMMREYFEIAPGVVEVDYSF